MTDNEVEAIAEIRARRAKNYARDVWTADDVAVLLLDVATLLDAYDAMGKELVESKLRLERLAKRCEQYCDRPEDMDSASIVNVGINVLRARLADAKADIEIQRARAETFAEKMDEFAKQRDNARIAAFNEVIERAQESVKKSQAASLDTAAAEILIRRLESLRDEQPKGGDDGK